MKDDLCPICGHSPDFACDHTRDDWWNRISELEAQLELKQSIICQDETKIKLLEAELFNMATTIHLLEAALAKAEDE